MAKEEVINGFFNSDSTIESDKTAIYFSPVSSRQSNKKLYKKEAEGSYTYRLIQSGPQVSKAECEVANQVSVEVLLMWGSNVLSVHTLTPPRNFYVGSEVPKSLEKSMLLVPAKILGNSPFAIVEWDGSRVSAAIPTGASSSFDLPQVGKMSLQDAMLRQLAHQSADGKSHSIVLDKGSRASITIGDFTVRITVGNAARKLTAPVFGPESRAVAGYMLGTFAAIAGCLVAMWAGGEPLAFSEETEMDKTTVAVFQQAERKARETDTSEQETPAPTNADQAKPTDNGGAHAGDPGWAGSPNKAVTGGFYQIQGPPDNPAVRLAKARSAIESNSYGAIGALNYVFGSDVALTAFDSSYDEALGRDKTNKMGNIAGAFAGDSFGFADLGNSGTDAGGGGWNTGLGLNNVGGFGHDRCVGSNCGTGYSVGISRNATQHKMHTPVIVDREAQSTGGHLLPEIVRRIVIANFAHFRNCYEIGLRQDPELRGSVAVRFVIGEDGAVETAFYSDGSLPNDAVKTCVVGVYKGLSFPPPEGGKVAVRFPIDFDNNS